MSYDSTSDTMRHKERVRDMMTQLAKEILRRAQCHDDSKLKEPEKTIFDEFTPKLKGSTYGSDEYVGFLKSMGAALKHHYSTNAHHPEHNEILIDGMTLLDVIEMYCDWASASERHENGSMFKSIGINKDRFKMSSQLTNIFYNSEKNKIVK